MKLTGKLKENVEKAENKEEAKKIIKEAGMILIDTELDQVAGGARPLIPKKGLPFQ
jgi:hypothetical protein